MKKLVLVALLAFGLTGCYWNDVIAPNQMAVQLKDGQIDDIKGPGGKYSDTSFYAELLVVNIDTLTFSVEDPEVLTSDNQAVSMKITIQARRQMDRESLTNLVTNWYALTNDEQLVSVISATAREGMKNGVRGFTLDGLLNDRNGLGQSVKTQLTEDSKKYSVEIVNVTIENIGPSTEYMGILSEKANITAQTAKELERQKFIEQQAKNAVLQAQKDTEIQVAQLAAEKALTEVQVEIAAREGKKTAAANQVYADNPQAFALEQLRLLDAIFGDSAVYYIPEGTQLTSIFGLEGLLAK